jgi:very-short-patch-repair endonuclease
MSKRAAGGRKCKPNVCHILFAQHMKELGIETQQEVPFVPSRRFRWDFVFALGTENGDIQRWGIEIDGYFNGRHKAFGGDNEKMRLATIHGWKFLRFSTNEVKRGYAKLFISQHLLGQKGREG